MTTTGSLFGSASATAFSGTAVWQARPPGHLAVEQGAVREASQVTTNTPRDTIIVIMASTDRIINIRPRRDSRQAMHKHSPAITSNMPTKRFSGAHADFTNVIHVDFDFDLVVQIQKSEKSNDRQNGEISPKDQCQPQTDRFPFDRIHGQGALFSRLSGGSTRLERS